jgi:UDP-galactose transporter B1
VVADQEQKAGAAVVAAAPGAVPHLEYAKVSFTYIAAMFASNAALNYVSYPTQVLAKSIKIVPVMLMRIVTVGKRYSLQEYLNVAFISLGIAVFILSGKKAAAKAASGAAAVPFNWTGMGLLLLSLLFDAFTGPYQERIRERYAPSSWQMMTWLNFYAHLFVLGAIGYTGELAPFVAFVQKYPVVLKLLLSFSLLSAVGQAFILWTLFRFNSLVLTIVTTTRKFVTILCSVLLFGHVLNTTQWVGVLLVFTGLVVQAYVKYQSKTRKLAAVKRLQRSTSVKHSIEHEEKQS